MQNLREQQYRRTLERLASELRYEIKRSRELQANLYLAVAAGDENWAGLTREQLNACRDTIRRSRLFLRAGALKIARLERMRTHRAL